MKRWTTSATGADVLAPDAGSACRRTAGAEATGGAGATTGVVDTITAGGGAAFIDAGGPRTGVRATGAATIGAAQSAAVQR